MIFPSYFSLGFEHVIPFGYDHMLFIISLFFFNSKIKSAIIQCSIFTIAHSSTLALATLGYLNFNSSVIEGTIALSIFFVALENLIETKLQVWRLAFIFLFGLLHGLGFASALNEIGIPQNEFLIALLAFNLGVEAAQLTVIAFCYFFVARLIQKKVWYQTKFVKPLSIIISSIALFWAVERFLT